MLERRLLAQAWAISVTLHGMAVALAMLLVAQMKPQPIQDLFQWNVALVEGLQEQSAEPGTQATRLLERAPQVPVQPKQPVSATSQAPARKPTPSVTARQQHVESPQAMERPLAQALPPAAVQQHQDAVAQMDATPVTEITKIEEAQHQHVEPALTPTVQPTASEEVPSSVQTADVSKESGISHTAPEPPQAATGTVRSAPTGRPDYGWLIESVSKRLAELKRYPVTARSNGLEGKVVLRVVIRADGQLAEVMVQKSSGYEELDMAAMETLREASPLRLRHELGRAQIAITVPLVYSLAR